MTLDIVIPALNEESSIGETVQRCLDARERIRRVGRVDHTTITVVSDGSTDRTAAIAHSIASREPAVRVIVFEDNRGYGAAIKEGFAAGSGELVAFLDADGTCDPEYFADLCDALEKAGASVALGSRMGPGSQMPAVRRVGNRLYAVLLGSLSGQSVSDTASGMRVIRRDALDALYPLPDGLHFTPAMSARALMSNQRIVEIAIPYAERVGKSKLRLLRDGVRFLFAIRDAVLLYHPTRIFGIGAVLCVAMALLWGMYPVEFYWRNHRLEEWMIYRLLLCGLLCTAAFGLTSAGVLSDQVLALVYNRRTTFWTTLLDRLFARTRLLLAAGILTLGAVIIVWPGLSQYVRSGHVTMHWSRSVVAVFLLQLALLSVMHAVVQKVVALWQHQLTASPRPTTTTPRVQRDRVAS